MSQKSSVGGSRATIKDINTVYFDIQNEQKPSKITRGPFNIFAMIDGHRGRAVAEFIKKYLIECIFRNENIMINAWYAVGLK